MAPSSLGLGTYLGEPTPAADLGYVAAARVFAAAGGTALYGMGRPEHAAENTAVLALPKVDPALLEGLFA